MTSQPTNSRIVGSQMADVDASEDPEARVAYLDLATREFDRLIRDGVAGIGLKPGDRVLDAGCGAGDAALLMADFVGATGKVVGQDISATMIAEARNRVQPGDTRVEFLACDLYELPFPNDSFDAARCSRVLQHLDDPLRAMREMTRVVRPGGTIMVLDPDFGAEMVDTDNRDIYARIRAAWELQRAAQPGDYWRGRQLYGLCRQASLHDLRVDGRAMAVTSLEVANRIARIIDMARSAVESGTITVEEAEIWEDEMSQRDREGRFFASAPAFAVYGTVPAGNGETA